MTKPLVRNGLRLYERSGRADEGTYRHAEEFPQPPGICLSDAATSLKDIRDRRSRNPGFPGQLSPGQSAAFEIMSNQLPRRKFGSRMVGGFVLFDQRRQNVDQLALLPRRVGGHQPFELPQRFLI